MTYKSNLLFKIPFIIEGWFRYIFQKDRYKAIALQRQMICKYCPHLVDGKCDLCGCPYKAKSYSLRDSCPEKRWFALNDGRLPLNHDIMIKMHFKALSDDLYTYDGMILTRDRKNGEAFVLKSDNCDCGMKPIRTLRGLRLFIEVYTGRKV